VASWQLVMSGALQVVGLAVLGLGGAFMLGARKNPLSLIFSLGGFVALILLAQAVATRPELIDGIGARVLSWYNSLRGTPADTGLNKWRETLSQLESVSLSRRELGEAFGWSLFNWIADVGCLLFACYATGGHPSLAGVTVAYAAARAVGSIPLMPGGLLVVEAVLVPGLVSSRMTLGSAISAMLIYRLASWIFISAIGWVVFFFMFRTEKDIDPDATVDEGVEQPPHFRPDPEVRHEPEPEKSRTDHARPDVPNGVGDRRAYRSVHIVDPNPLGINHFHPSVEHSGHRPNGGHATDCQGRRGTDPCARHRRQGAPGLRNAADQCARAGGDADIGRRARRTPDAVEPGGRAAGVLDTCDGKPCVHNETRACAICGGVALRLPPPPRATGGRARRP